MKWKKYFICSLALLPAFFSLIFSQSANAQPLSLASSQIIYRPGFQGDFVTATIDHPSSLVPANFLTLNSTSALQIRNVDFSGRIQTAKGSSFAGDISFRLSVNTDPEGFLYQPGWNCDWIAELRFKPEQGTVLSNNTQISSCKVTSTGSVQSLIDVTLSTSGTLSQSTTISSFLVAIRNPSGVIYSAETNPSYPIYLTLWNADVNFVVSEDPNTEILGTIDQGITDINNNLEQQQQQDQQDRDNVQSASDSGEDNANASQEQNEQATSTLLSVIGSFIQALGAPASNCQVRTDLGNIDLGTLDFCTGKPAELTPIINTVCAMVMCIPIYLIAKDLFRRFVYITTFAQGGEYK